MTTAVARTNGNGAALLPANMAEAMRLAEMMATSKLVPAALQKSAADCLMVIQQAIRWEMDPFAVAQECSVIQGKLMHSGKLVAAVVNSRGNLASRLSYTYEGDGNDRIITITGRLRGEACARTVAVRLADARTNANVWKTQPDQQLMYHGVRVWARRHTPELMLGVWSPEEFNAQDDDGAPTPVADVTPLASGRDPVAPDDPDYLPAADGIEARVVDQRKDYEALQKEMRAITDPVELQKWGATVAKERMGSYRKSWQNDFRRDYTDYLQALRKPPEPEADWLDTINDAYSKCETAADAFEVDKKLFLPFIGSVSPDDRDRAQTLRNEHLARIEGSPQ